MEGAVLAFGLATVFYLIVPGVGAFAVRYRWRTFRRRMAEASLFPHAGYHQMRQTAERADGGYLGDYRYVGNLEAIQGDNAIWLNDGAVSFAVDMRGQTVALLPSFDEHGRLPRESPQLVPWKKLSHLTEGVRTFVAGGFYSDGGRGMFRGSSSRPLTIVMYGGRDDSMMRRGIATGRQRNEYWNQLTPASLAAGALALLTVAYVQLRIPGHRFDGLFAVTLSLVPIIPLLPPGVVLFFLYRRFWRRGRSLRAERDTLTLPLRYFPGEIVTHQAVPLPSGDSYTCVRVPTEDVSVFERSGARLEELSQHARKLKEAEPFHVFGGVHSGGSLGPPKDPLAEFVIIPGDPRSLAALCEKKARRLEMTALLFVALGIAVNLYFVLLLLSNLVR
jgi:hypothetical protein